MECAEFQERLSVLLDGEMTRSDAIALEEHVSVCKDCRRAYARMAALDERLRSLPTPVAHTDLTSKVRAGLFGEKRSPWESLPFSIWRTVPVLMLILAVALGLGNMAGKSMTSFLVDRPLDAKAEFLALDTDNSLADAVLALGSEETSR